jgi:hypothetical protein
MKKSFGKELNIGTTAARAAITVKLVLSDYAKGSLKVIFFSRAISRHPLYSLKKGDAALPGLRSQFETRYFYISHLNSLNLQPKLIYNEQYQNYKTI